MNNLLQDLRYAVRQLLKNPGFTAVSLLTLAVAIGSTSAIYSVVRATILDPLPVPEADRLMCVKSFNTREDKRPAGVAPLAVAELREHADVFTELTVHQYQGMKYRANEFIELVNGKAVSPNFFSLWHTPPIMGRLFAADDDKPGSERVIIISHGFWKRRLGADPDILGKSIELDGGFLDSPFQQYTVVGVMPPHFKYPASTTEYWVPAPDPKFAPDRHGQRYWMRNYQVAFRLPSHLQAEQAQAILNTITARHLAEYERNEGWVLRLGRVQDEFADQNVRRTLWTLFAVVGLVWLIACANLANLLIARAQARQHELAVRGALGASRTRLLRLLLVESLVLSVAGGCCGLILTDWGIRAMDVFLGGIRLKPFELNWAVFATAMGVALITALFFGLAPAWQASRPRIQETLKQTGAAMTIAASGRRLARGLIVGEVALAVVLLSAAGLMIQSVVRLLKVDVGFRLENLLQLYVIPPYDKYRMGDREAYTALMNRLHEEFRALPGVTSVGMASYRWDARDYLAAGHDQPIPVESRTCGLENQNPFVAMGAPLIEGRFLDRSDRGRKSVVVNQSLAQAFWLGQSALGKRFWRVPGEGEENWEIVGVVGNTKTEAFDQAIKPIYFRPVEEVHGSGSHIYFFVRTASDPAAFTRSIQRVIKNVEPGVIQTSIQVLAEEFHRKTEGRRRYTLFLTLFAGVGLALSVIGLYGLLAYSARRRIREIGIRMALGATRSEVRNLLLGEGMKLVVSGLVIGLIGALASARLLQNQLFEIRAYDPLTFLVMSVLLMIVAAISCYIPARRAANTDPMQAVRYE